MNLDGHMGLTIKKEGSPMAEIAQQNTFVVDELGVRRLVVAGSPIPIGWHVAEGEVETKTVATRELGLPVIDQEASKSHAERTGDPTSVAPDAGISFAAVEQLEGEKPAESNEELLKQQREAKAKFDSQVAEPKPTGSVDPVEQKQVGKRGGRRQQPRPAESGE